MRNLFFVMLLFASFTSVFPQFTDDFSDGDFTKDPTWYGEEEKFRINEDFQLQLDAPRQNGSAYLVTSSARVRNTCWEFCIQMDFVSSSTNYAAIYLCSDQQNLTKNPNGFVVRIGDTDRNAVLLSQEGSKTKEMIKGEKARFNVISTPIFIRVTLDKVGNFTLYSRLEEEEEYKNEGTFKVETFPESEWMGVVCYYTSSRSNGFLFDYFKVTLLEDDDILPEPGTFDDVAYDDVIFNELMVKPIEDEPEFIECYNRTDKRFNSKNWVFHYGNKSYDFPEVVIEPYSYFILCKSDVKDYFEEEVQVIGFNSFPQLANSGNLIRLEEDGNLLITWFEYKDKMYGDNDKKNDGGWSLECIDPENRSNSLYNWSASVDPDGKTPGKINSINNTNPDNIRPSIEKINRQDSVTYTVTFSKPMSIPVLMDSQNYLTEGDSGFCIDSLSTNYPQGTELFLRVNGIPPVGEIFKIALSSLCDLAGNYLDNAPYLTFGNGFAADSNDIVFNELLPNPYNDGNEYIELYNRSDKSLELSWLSVASRKNTDGTLNKAYPLSDVPLILYPKEYLLITKDINKVCEFYTCRPDSRVVELDVMPALTNTAGCIVLIDNRNDQLIDEFNYSESLHSTFLTVKRGVSLERINPDMPTDMASNWTSASSDSGYGTPGYENSQAGEVPTGRQNLSSSTVYIENNYLHYEISEHGCSGRILLFDISGRLVNTLATNYLLSGKGKIDLSENLNSLSGLYILYVEIISQSNQSQSFKLPYIIQEKY